MEITVLAFGQLAEITGSSFKVNDVSDTDALNRYLQTAYPPVNSLAYRIAVNKKIIGSNTVIDASTTVALLPPFSGG